MSPGLGLGGVGRRPAERDLRCVFGEQDSDSLLRPLVQSLHGRK